MSRPDLKDAYSKWLSSDEGQAIHINTLEITQGSPANFTYLFCDYSQDFSADKTYTALPMRFGVESRKDTTEQQLSVTIDALDGQVYTELKAITDANRFDPINVTYRVYLDNDVSGPAIDPPSNFILVGAVCDLGRVVLQLATVNAPRRRSGTYATVDKFPALRFM